ncbi:unnamed protein product [Acanthoscelides obtectus]|uniref:Uncharacterized protein n=1 Tax=Acanthoscelides obtectus TaxID=200917 RepID=A0A9P0P708_ACAOB|nr:unnamed protein product [Acanthoscelides obtectus]CAK1651747.1 hypothetical protein AOBTE_LOCUS17432 [Acanthoscelides obtectus]
MKVITSLLSILLLWRTARSAPTKTEERQGRNIGFYDYLQPDPDYNSFETDNDDYVSMALEGNDLSRTIPSRKSARPYNSPIYYIRLPPQPYMFVPGLGYVSQPAASSVSQFVNLPLPFVANGKPSNIYQWSGTFNGFPTQASPPPPPPQPAFPPSFGSFPQVPPTYQTPAPPTGVFPGYPASTKPLKPAKKPLTDSKIHRLPGTYTFNGKPDDIFVLRDSYNSLYNDVLQNVYP